MQFHHNGYVSADPRIRSAAGVGLDRPQDIPDEVDVLIVGTGPAGMITAAQLSQFPDVTTRIVERRAGRLEVGQADGIQPRSVETFDAFGFAERIVAEGCKITETAFWKPDPADVSRIVRTSRVLEDPNGVSEYPHITVNQARVLDYFAEFMANAPTRMKPDYGLEFQGLALTNDTVHPVAVTLSYVEGPRAGQTRVVRAKYVVGADGAHSRVRDAIGCRAEGGSSHHAWGVMDLLAETDFPDIRVKCAIQSEEHGTILLIPREGGYLFRLYVDLGDVPAGDRSIRNTTVEQTIARAQKIFHPYALDVREVAWYSVYQVGHRVCDRFDDVPVEEIGRRLPHVFIAGDASHTHSAKAGQGMNVSMQDGFNLGWKLGHVLQGRAPEALLATYSAERQEIGQNIIDFDKRWASTMAKRPEDFDDPRDLENAYLQITEFAQGFMTQYSASMITGGETHRSLATGFPVGKRFRSARVTRVADADVLHLGHEHKADGRWRIYVFADASPTGQSAVLAALGDWFLQSPDSPLTRSTPAVLDANAWFDLKVIYPQPHIEVDLNRVPLAFFPRVGRFQLQDRDNVYAATPGDDIFDVRGVARTGALIVVRPDMYVAQVLPLAATRELGEFFKAVTLPQRP
ncbi:MAG TPA: FAD-dependent monooxygenase [Castellaniella sp.]|uniref:FAD-dependent monooxygenase n=1 Tax=Castellaniella sp. TaxID=1955812 RepID=UPI002F0A1D39